MKCNLRCTVSLLLVLLFLISPVLPCPASAADLTLEELFLLTKESEETETLPTELYEAFVTDPNSFVILLAQEDMLVQEHICNIVAQYSGGTAEYIQLVLSLLPKFSPQERGSTLFFLLNIKADFSSVPADFTQTLFNALEYSDGAMTTRCYSLMEDLLEADPFGLVADIVQEDEEFQASCVTILALDNHCWDGLTMDDAFHQSLTMLTENEALTEAERSFVDRLAAEVARLEQEADASRNGASETTVPTKVPLTPETSVPTVPTETSTSPTETGSLVIDPAETDSTPFLIAALCIAISAVVIAGMKRRRK